MKPTYNFFETSDDEKFEELPKIEEKEIEEKRKTPMRCHTERSKKIFEKRRFSSEQSLLDNMPWHMEKEEMYFIISQGDVDSLSFLKHIIRQQKLEYLLLSTWCIGIEDSLEIKNWVEKGLIGRLDVYLGEIAKASYANAQKDLTEIAESTGGRCGIFRNHSKVMVCYGEKFDCAILSSANINTNTRCENTTIVCSTEICDFYKDFFDGINPFNKVKETWKKYEVKR